MIFSEEIKEARKYGYSIKIIYAYQFERGKNVFKEEKHYAIKKNANNLVERQIAKLRLNSLYGKFGVQKISIVK
jgi:hypothetical protein